VTAVLGRDARPEEGPPPWRRAVFARMGGSLLPLGCQRFGRWVRETECVAGGEVLDVRMSFRHGTDSDVVRGTPAPIYFEVSNTEESGLLLPGWTDPHTAGGPLVGFGTFRVAAPLQLTPSAKRKFSENLAAWCRDPSCGGDPKPDVAELAQQPTSTADEKRALDVVAAVLRENLATVPPSKLIGSFEVSVGGKRERLIEVEVVADREIGMKAGVDELGTLHYLVASTPTGMTPLGVFGNFTHSLAEAGDLLGAVDVEGDGTDELIIEWQAIEAVWWYLVKREPYGFVVLGSIGYGT